MGHITTGGLVSEVRGSVGSLTYSRNAYGPYVKAKLNQTIRDTAPQLVTRGHMSNAVAAWQGLTDRQRRDWSVYAKDYPIRNSLGKLRVLTGYNFYLQCYLNKSMWNSDPPLLFSEKYKIPKINDIRLEKPTANFALVFDWNTTGIMPITLVSMSIDKPVTTRSFNPSWLRFFDQMPTIQNNRWFFYSRFQAIYGYPFPFTVPRRVFFSMHFIELETGATIGKRFFSFISTQRGSILT